MEENEILYDKIKEMLGTLPDSFNILEQSIDIELQMEYFENSYMERKNIDPVKIMEEAITLFDPGLTVPEIKAILSRIAVLEKIEAYRIIEKYMKNPHPSVREWGTMALQESRMLIESKLLDENQVFISTGLGGKGNKLRYFVALIARNKCVINGIQKKVIRNEFDHTLKKYGGEIEKFKFSGHLATIITVIPLNVTIKHLFDEAIYECNQFGNFLEQNFIITNVKTLAFKEIQDYLNSSGETDK